MYRRLLTWLRCPACRSELTVASPTEYAEADDLDDATLRCTTGHTYPVVGGIPRMLPDQPLSADMGLAHDRRTQENFSRQWAYHDQGDRTWGIQLDDRLRQYVIEPLGLTQTQLEDAVFLDAGCGNGSLSVAVTEAGPEVIGLDLSSGLELGHSFRHTRASACPERVHFVQGDLIAPPLAVASLDIIYSSGVLHHTQVPKRTFDSLRTLLRPGGTFYVWVYRRQPLVTPMVSAIRSVTTRVDPDQFAIYADRVAPAVLVLCRILNAIGLPKYVRTRRETALALIDVFGTPHTFYHTPEQVHRWFINGGFDEVRLVNENKRGFGMCGRLPKSGNIETREDQ